MSCAEPPSAGYGGAGYVADGVSGVFAFIGLRGAYGPHMGASTLTFDPFSQEFFDDPYETYRWMRARAPSIQRAVQLLSLTRHEDVASAFKDPATYSSAYGVDLSMVRSGGPPPDVRLLQFMDPPEHRHMRSVLNKLFTPRAIQAQRSTVTAIIDKYLGAIDSDELDVVREFTAPFPVEVITTMLGVPEDHVQHARLWTDATMHREPGQIETDEKGKQAILSLSSTTSAVSRSIGHSPATTCSRC